MMIKDKPANGKVTLKDIAKTADVSIATVSQVLNKRNTKVASQETLEKIYAAADVLQYTAGNSGNHSRIGIIVGSPLADKYANSFYSNYYKGVEDELHKEGYVVDFFYSSNQIENSPAVYNHIMSLPSLALISIDNINNNERITALLKKAWCTVDIGFVAPGSQQNHRVYPDIYQATKQGLNNLRLSGRKKIALFSGDPSLNNIFSKDDSFEGFIDSRSLAYRDFLRENMIEFNESLVNFIYDWNPYDTYSAVLNMCNNKVEFDAIFACNDEMALASLNALKSRGVRVPEDVALIGFDGQPDIFPGASAISTYHIPCEELGRTAVQILLLCMAGKLPLPMEISSPVEFIRRDTCGLAEELLI